MYLEAKVKNVPFIIKIIIMVLTKLKLLLVLLFMAKSQFIIKRSMTNLKKIELNFFSIKNFQN